MKNLKNYRILLLILIIPFFGAGLFAGTPSGLALPATDITGISATLNGLVNPNNESTIVTFEYSTDENFSAESVVVTVTADESPLTGSGYLAVSKAITGLTPATTYHFRIISENATDTNTSVSSVSSFFTTDLPSDVTTGIAGPVTTTTAQLNGTVNAKGNSTVVTFEYGTTASYGTLVTADQSPVTGSSDTAVSKSISGLTANTTYHYRVVGVNVLGTSNGDDKTFYTSAQTAPSATTDDATYNDIASPNTANLNGTVNANNADTTVTFQYGLTTSYGTTVTADQSPVLGTEDTVVSKTISGLTADTTYHYRVVATNGQGTTNGADMTFYNTAVPYARTDAATPIGQTTATLKGTVNPKRLESSGDTTVIFEYGLTNAYGTSAEAIQSPLSGGVEQTVSLGITGLSPSTTYHYRVTATSPSGTGTGEDLTFTTSSLPTVITTSANPVGTTTATLNGTVNANSDSTTVTFEYGTTTSYGTTVTADQSPVTGSSDTWVSKGISGLTNATLYHYRAVGTNSSGTVYGEDSTFTAGITPPSVTTDAAASVANTSVTLNGTINANGNDTIASFDWGPTASYGKTAGASPGTITGSSNTAITAGLTGLTPGTVYHYRARGWSAGNTIYGVDMTFTTTESPTVATDPANPVSTNSAILNGTVNANGYSTTVTFEYGTTTGYGTTVTADQSPVTGAINTAVFKAITGLTMNTTYHYRVVGTSSSGTSYGADMTFFTSTPAIPIAVTAPATLVSDSGATLNGTVNANNYSTIVTFEYGTTAAYGTTVTADQSPLVGSVNTAVSFSVSGLANSTTYHYRVVAVNGSGTSNGADMTFTTSSKPIATTGAATNILYTSATLNGVVNNNNNVTSTTANFDYGLTNAYGTTLSGTPSIVTGTTDTAVTLDLSGLTAGTTYHYRIWGVSAFGFTYGDDMTFTTPTGPTAVTDVATSVGSTSATFNGTVNAQNASTTVTFEYGLTTSYGLSATADQSPATGNTNTAVSNSITTLMPNTTYHYRVIAVNVNGTAYGADLNFTTTAVPPTVSTLAASEIGGTGATLNGSVNAEGDNTTVTFEYGTTTGYGTSVTADQSPALGTGNTIVSKGITGLTSNTTYHYRVVGVNGSGTSYGADMTFTTGTNTPNATTMSATAVSSNGATLNGRSNANGSSTIVTFEYGLTTAYGKAVEADQTPITGSIETAITNTISGLIASEIYHYRLVAENSYGITYGADMTFTTNAAGTAIVTTGNASSRGTTYATLNGIVNPNSISTKVTFQYGTTTSLGSTSTSRTINGATDIDISIKISDLNPNTRYFYRIVGKNISGTVNGNILFFKTLRSAPTATTNTAYAISETGATLNATVNANNLSTIVSFEYGTTLSYGTTVTADQSPLTGSVNHAVTQAIDGLLKDTTYHYRVVAVNSEGTTYGNDMTFITSFLQSAILLNRDSLNFGSNKSFTTPAQNFTISNSGEGTLNWAIDVDADWIICTPQSGTGSAIVSVSVDISGLSDGTYTGTISVSDDNAVNTPQTILVRLTIGGSTSPFGSFDTPVDGSTVYGSIPVTGWALDDIEVISVSIYRDSVSGESSGLIYIGDAIFVDGARPDVEAAYPNLPFNYRAGWGYMLLTNMLPSNGNGTFVLWAKARDIEGNTVTLGSKTITSDNENAVKPFGAIDTPSQGGTASGNSYVNFGWALTPQPNTIPVDGSTIKVWLDGIPLGNPVYNQYREDIATLFPGYNNSNGAVGYFYIDTTAYSNGVHTIAWSVVDDAGNADGIGSRYFNITNTSSDKKGAADKRVIGFNDLIDYELIYDSIDGKKGFNAFDYETQLTTQDSRLTIKELKRIELDLNTDNREVDLSGYLKVGKKLRKLPIGSSLINGKFFWQPGPGFIGTYDMVFVDYLNKTRKEVKIIIKPKFD